MNNRAGGIYGENRACAYLESKGYRILERNYRTVCGEIDIIAQIGECLAFVEVKQRTSGRYGLPEEAVTIGKQRHIARAAALYLKTHYSLEPEFRFDVIAVEGETVRHIANAFTSGIPM